MVRAVAGWSAEVRTGLTADVRRVADRLRTLSQAQLAAPVPPYPSRAAGGRAVAQRLATAAQGLEAGAAGDEPRWRDVPALSDFAVGDQLAVTGHDLLAALDEAGPADLVWAPGARRTAISVVTDAADQLAALRRLL
jgi:hypothetical protein